MVLVALMVAVGGAVAQPPPGGGGQGMRGGGRLVMGTVAAVDAARGLLGIMPQDGQGVWVAVTAETQMTLRVPIQVKDLQLQQVITVVGRPTALVAQDLNLTDQAALPPVPPVPGAPPAAGGQAPAAGGQPPAGAGGPAPGAPPGAPGGQGGNRQALMGMVFVTGTVTKLEPLTITTQEGTEVALTLAPEATVARTMTVTLGQLDQTIIGQPAMAYGQNNDQGVYQGRFVRLGQQSPLGGFMGGGFMGGGFGGGGFGGGGNRGGGNRGGQG